MRVISTFFGPSSIIHSLKCRLSNNDLEHLVIAKPNKLEVFSLQPEGAKFECSLEIWGIISSLNAVPPQDEGPCSLLITTECPNPKAIGLEYGKNENDEPALRELYHLSLHSPFSRVMEDFEGAIVHPSGDIAVVATYVGKLKILYFSEDRRSVERESDCMLTHLNVFAMTFFAVSDVYILAILHRDYTGSLKIVSREVTEDGDLEDASIVFPEITVTEDYANALLPIPASDDAPPGLLVLGGKFILFYEVGGSRRSQKGKEKATRSKSTRKSTTSTAGANDIVIEPRSRISWPLSDLTAYAPIDTDNSRILLGDKFGKLDIFALTRLNGEVSLRLEQLGETSPTTTITHLNAGVIFVGSHYGNSQIIRISPSSGGYEGIQLDTVEEFQNIAPIMDAIMIDSEGSGQPQIVTCSGAQNTGSLRVIRSGVDLQELATADGMGYIRSMWPFRLEYESPYDDTLAVTALQSTRFYSLARGLEELDGDHCPGLSDECTLAIGNMTTVIPASSRTGNQTLYENSNFAVQVTPNAAILINLSTGMREHVWKPGTEIMAASLSSSQIAVALKGRKLVTLMIKDSQIVELRHRFFSYGEHDEISSLSIVPYDPSLKFSNYVAVGFYGSDTVTIVQMADLMSTVLPPTPMPHLPVSLLLSQFTPEESDRRRPIGYSKNHPTHLLVGLGDGNVHAYSLNFAPGQATIVDDKLIPLGSTRPAILVPIRTSLGSNDNQRCVFVSGGIPAVLYWHNGRLKHSPLVRKGISTACMVNSSQFPSSIIFAVANQKDGKIEATSLLIARIGELHKLHIRKIPFGLDNPIRIAHHPDARLFCVGCQRTQPHGVGEYPLESSSIKFIDETTFEQLSHFPCDTNEEVTVTKCLSLSVGKQDSDQRKTFIVVGTQYYSSGETEAHEGRLWIFESQEAVGLSRQNNHREDAGKEGRIRLVTSHKVKGCVFSVSEVQGKLVAAINESVYVFTMQSSGPSQTFPSSGHTALTLDETARWTHNYIVANMVTRQDKIYIGDAISSLSVVRLDESTQKLVNIARDYTPLWPVAIETLDNGLVIAGNNDCNLLLYSVNQSEKKLEQAGNFYLGDSVNVFLNSTLTGSSEEGLRAEKMFVTSTGRIGVISEFNARLSFEMTALQRNLDNSTVGVGGIKHSEWRAPKNSRGISDSNREATGFLDGDFLERFLEFDSNSNEAMKARRGNSDAEKLDLTYGEVVHVLEQLQSVH